MPPACTRAPIQCWQHPAASRHARLFDGGALTRAPRPWRRLQADKDANAGGEKLTQSAQVAQDQLTVQFASTNIVRTSPLCRLGRGSARARMFAG